MHYRIPLARCSWHGPTQIAAPAVCLVAPNIYAEYIDGSMAAFGRAQYRIAGAVYQLRRDGVLAAVEQTRKAA